LPKQHFACKIESSTKCTKATFVLCHDESQYLLHSLFTDKDSRLCPDNCNVAHTFFHGKKAPIEFCCTVCSCQSWHHAPPHARLMQQCDAVGRPSMAFANVDFAQLSSFCSHFSLHLQYISYPAGGTLPIASLRHFPAPWHCCACVLFARRASTEVHPSDFVLRNE
jgi:hypothetical protein